MSLVHLHLMMNHVPVIGTLFVIFTLLAALRLRSSDMTKLGLLMLAGVGIVAVAVYFTGEPAEDAVEHLAGVSRAVIHEHEEAAEVAFATSAFAGGLALLALWWTRRRELPRWIAGAALVMSIIVGGMMAWTASLGGNIRHTELTATAAAGQVAPDGD
jgi:glucan phosphoethanolaminetransferase (alkaline phosphatase superfamily)